MKPTTLALADADFRTLAPYTPTFPPFVQRPDTSFFCKRLIVENDEVIQVQAGIICKKRNNEYKHLKQYDKRLVVLHAHQPFIMK